MMESPGNVTHHRPVRELAAIAAVAVAMAPIAMPGFAVWPPTAALATLCALLLVAVPMAAWARPRPGLGDCATVAPSFVVDFAALLLFGPGAGALVAATSTVSREVGDANGRMPSSAVLLPRVVTALAATGAAGTALFALDSPDTHWQSAWHVLPIAIAVLSYCLVIGTASVVVLPLTARRPVSRSWAADMLRSVPPHVIAATLSVGIVELIEHRLWMALLALTVPLYFVYRAYSHYIARRDESHRSEWVLDSTNQGVAVVDQAGVVTTWNGALERLLGFAADRMVGRLLFGVLPALSRTELPRAMRDAFSTSAPVVVRVGIRAAVGARMFEVRVLPNADGALTLHWRDVTTPWRAERQHKRSEERFALVADAANDGLWEWDLRSNELYVSGRWRTLVGLDGAAGVFAPENWFERVHPDDVEALQAAIDAHLAGLTEQLEQEYRIRIADGSYRTFLSRGVAMRNQSGQATRIAGSLTDTTERALVEERLRNAGSIDSLTGLSNRAVFVERLGRRIEELKSRGGARFAALYLDLDRFKVINDSLGHVVGDQLLTLVSRRIEGCLRPGDVLARLGGDEFAVLLQALGDENQANAVALRIQDALKAPFSIAGREVFTSASIGIAFGRAHYNSPDEIMRDADTAMYQAKARGKARHELFDADMHAREQDRLGFENDLRHAIERRDVEMHYQPIVSLESGKCVGVESLVRWTRNGKPVSPATFIPIAEELGLIESLGTWVLEEACSTFAHWRRQFPDSALDHVTVNVSSRQLLQHNFVSMVEQTVRRTGMRPSQLRLEITETALMDNPSEAARLLGQLREFGVKIYLDDFGTGFSSLSHLHRLPVDALKIDRSFVTSLLLPERPAIVESILALARTLKTNVVAEGIENDVQARELERLGCTHAQGFLFARPLATHLVEDVLRGDKPLGPKGEPEPVIDLTRKDDFELFFTSKPFEWPDEAREPVGVAEPTRAEASSSRLLPPPTDSSWWS